MRFYHPLLLLAILCLLFSSSSCTVASSSRLDVVIDLKSDHGWAITLDGKTYLEGGPYAFHTQGQWYINNPQLLDGNLMDAISVTTDEGIDSIGEFESTTIAWKVDQVAIETTFQVYQSVNAIVFRQHYPQGLPATNTSDRNTVMSIFPSFPMDSSRGFLSYNGDFLKYTAAGPWRNESDSDLYIASGLSSGPTLLLDPVKPEQVLLIAAYSEFMAQSQLMQNNVLQFGVMGSITSLPAGYTIDHLLYFGSNGIYETIQEWGDLMRTTYGKPKRVYDGDFSNNWLGYNTDNGAYYYYLTEAGKNYEDTLLDVYNDAQIRQIPYRMILLDSWWYEKGRMGGVRNWTAMPQIFPNGLQYLFEKTNWNFIAHNRYWSSDNVYAAQNGGLYEFIIDEEMHSAMPQDEAFWDELFKTSYQWGLRVYEQDWLYNEFEGVNAALTNVTVGKRWLTQMANAAQRAGIFIQYCMPWPRHLLSSVQFPAVSQVRASDDYQPGNEQWQIGYTGMLYHALGLAPFKDNFWTTQYQPGNPYDLNEPNTALHSIVATLSTGPVTIGDAIGGSNIALIMKSCRADGKLLKPDHPLHYIDSHILYAAFRSNPSYTGSGPDGHVYVTHTDFGSVDQRTYAWSIVVTVNLTTPYQFSTNELDAKQSTGDQPYLVWSWTNATNFLNPLPKPVLLQPKSSLTLAPCTISDFIAYYYAPVFMNGFALLGEWMKWVPVSKQRIRQMSWTKQSIRIELEGQVNEAVTMAFANAQTLEMHVTSCTIGSFGAATLDVDLSNGNFAYQCGQNGKLSEEVDGNRETIALE